MIILTYWQKGLTKNVDMKLVADYKHEIKQRICQIFNVSYDSCNIDAISNGHYC